MDQTQDQLCCLQETHSQCKDAYRLKVWMKNKTTETLFCFVFGRTVCENSQPRIEQVPPALERQSFKHWTTRETQHNMLTT